MLDFFTNHFSEILTFIGGFITGGVTMKIYINMKQHNATNNQTGDNLANSGSVAAGMLNAPVNIHNNSSKNSPAMHAVGWSDCENSHFINCSSSVIIKPPSSELVEKQPLSPQAKSLLKQFCELKGDLLLTFAPGGIIQGVQTNKNQDISVDDFLAVNKDLDNLVIWGYLERQSDSNAGRKYCLTATGRDFAQKL